MLLDLSTGVWPAQQVDRIGVDMGTFGHNLRCLLLNLLPQPPSWPIGRRITVFPWTSVKCSWDCLIALTLSYILFRLVQEDTRIWKIWQGHNCDTSSIATLQGCSVGGPGALKVAKMVSQQSFMPHCANPSFRDVLVRDPGVSHDVQAGEEGTGISVNSVVFEQPPQQLLLLVPRSNSRRRGRPGKENVQPRGADQVLGAKPKRKYVRKMKVDGRADVGEVPTPSSPKPKRKYTRKGPRNTDTAPRATGTQTTERAPSRSNRRRQVRESHNPSDLDKGTSDFETPDMQLVDPSSFAPPTTRAHFAFPFRVRVFLRDLLWGGEILAVPCPFAVGMVLGGEEAVEGIEVLRVDFGSYLGIQDLPRAVCHQMEYRTTTPTGNATHAEDSVLNTDSLSNWEIGAATIAEVPHPPAMGAVGPQGWELPDSDSEHDWDPALSSLGSEDCNFSSGASSIDMQEDAPMTLLGELGLYPLGPEEEKPELEQKYSESNWHARTWSLLPRHPFTGKSPGASEHLQSGILMQPIQYFLLFWDETLQRKVVRESNDYANYVDPATGKRKGGESATRSITLEEFRQFTGICCLMGVRDQPSIRDYWRRGDGALFCSDVASTMPRWRFEYIMRCLHMTSKHDFVTNKQSPFYDPIGKCRWILEHIEARFQQFWNLSPYVTVDECMVAYNGRFCFFKQYLPAKPITHGIKIWAMACSVTSYVYKLEIYVGKDNTQPGGPAAAQIGMAGQVVSRLTKGLEGHWYTVTCDNYFTSPYLFDDLLSRGFYAVGTARKQRKGFPTSLCIMHEQPRGTLHVRVHRDQKMAAIHWQDTKGVYFLSTAADPMVPGGVLTSRVSGQRIAEIPTSPIQILYSQKMGGVDVGDQNRSYYSTQIATKKWWHRVYFFCLDSSIANAFTIQKEISKRLGEKPLTHKDFQLHVAYALMGRPYRAASGEKNKVRLHQPRPSDLLGTHIPRKTNLRRVCQICKCRTFWICQQCEGVRLCMSECFEFFHTRETAV